jgi:hypothetical protein
VVQAVKARASAPEAVRAGTQAPAAKALHLTKRAVLQAAAAAAAARVLVQPLSIQMTALLLKAAAAAAAA